MTSPNTAAPYFRWTKSVRTMGTSGHYGSPEHYYLLVDGTPYVEVLVRTSSDPRRPYLSVMSPTDVIEHRSVEALLEDISATLGFKVLAPADRFGLPAPPPPNRCHTTCGEPIIDGEREGKLGHYANQHGECADREES